MTVPDFMVHNLDGSELFSSEIFAVPSFKLFIFFTPSDCLTCYIKDDFWKHIKDRENLKVIGIVQHSDMDELRNWIKGEGFRFQVYCDLDSDVINSFGINETPIMILSDSTGHILFASDFRGASSNTSSLIKTIDRFLYSTIQ